MAAGKVSTVDEKETKTGKVYYRLKIGKDWYSFWNDDPPDEGDQITFETERNGDFVNITEWSPAGKAAKSAGKAEKGPETHNGYQTSDETWERKDRAIMMESALSSAAQYMRAVAVARPEAVTVANWLEAGKQAYKVALKARNGENLDATTKALEAAKEASREANAQADEMKLPF